jgi:hypothetical protein
MSRRHLAIVILTAWVGALGWLGVREFGRRGRASGAGEQVVSPGAAYYKVMLGDSVVGYALSLIDTLPVSDTAPAQVFVQYRLFLAAGNAPVQRRYEQHTAIYLNTDLKLRWATTVMGGPQGLTGWFVRVDGDTLKTDWYRGADTIRSQVELDTVPIPTEAMPLWIATYGAPRPGVTLSAPVIDLGTMARRRETWTAVAESTFLVPDSVVRHPDRRVEIVTSDTVRGWRLGGTDRSVTMHQWVEENGLVVEKWTGGGLRFVRGPFESTFDEWNRISDSATGSSPLSPPGAWDARPVRDLTRGDLRVLLRGAEYPALEAEGPTQRMSGDTVETYDPRSWRGRMAFRSVAPLPMTGARFAQYLADEPLLTLSDSALSARAVALTGGSQNAREVGMQIHRWVRGLRPVAPGRGGVPRTAAEVLRTGEATPEEAALLAVALGRRVGLPSRLVGGVMAGRDRFYAHTWYEIFIGDWVGVDPAQSDFSASPAHIRLVTGASGRWSELLPLAGGLVATGTPPALLP